MQNIISANQKSKTEQFMIEQGEYIPYYKDPSTVSTLGIQFQTVDPVINIGTGDPANRSILIKLPPGAGFMLHARTKFTYGVDGVVASEVNALAAIHNLRDIAFEVNGQPIITKTKRDLLAQYRDSKDEALKNHLYRYAQMLDESTEKPITASPYTGTVVSYLGHIESFLSKVERALLLNVVKDVYVRYNFDSNANSGLTNALTSMTAKLEVLTYMPKLSVYNEMVQKDWSESFIFQMSNCYPEVFPLLAGETTSKKITLNCPFLAYKTHISLQANTNSVALGLPLNNILSVSMDIGGIPFFSAVKPSWFGYVSSKSGYSNLKTSGANAVSFDDSGAVTINWGVLADQFMNSGTVFFQELKGSTITVTYAGGATSQSLYVDHEYFQGVQYTPSVGGGNLAIVSNN